MPHMLSYREWDMSAGRLLDELSASDRCGRSPLVSSDGVGTATSWFVIVVCPSRRAGRSACQARPVTTTDLKSRLLARVGAVASRLAVFVDRGEPAAEGGDDDGRREEVAPHENGFGGGVVGSCDRWDER
jgi:hypothetical protein